MFHLQEIYPLISMNTALFECIVPLGLFQYYAGTEFDWVYFKMMPDNSTIAHAMWHGPFMYIVNVGFILVL